MRRPNLPNLPALLTLLALAPAAAPAQDTPPRPTDPPEEETADPRKEAALLSGTRQLTFEGRRAGEGYFSADGSKMVFQSEREKGNPFYQIYLLDLQTGDTQRLSPGHGKTTCAWIHPDGKSVIYASTHEDPAAKADQQKEIEERRSSRIRKYSWDYDEDYEIYSHDLESGTRTNLTQTRGYDAEGALSPDGRRIVFASNRHAYTTPPEPPAQERFALDASYLMDIYTMAADGSDVRRLTDTDGYDGGPFFSADGSRICWRRFNEKGEQAEIMTMASDGSAPRQLTSLGAMSWAPFFHPSGDYLIFTTNVHGFANFELYLVDAAGQHPPARVTHSEGFDGLPTFSPDGKTLSWTSNRNAAKQSQIFLANWDDQAARQLLGLATPNQEKTTPSPAATPPAQTSAEITTGDIRQHITYLASDALQGRLTGTEGEKLATRYVADTLAAFGLQGAAPGGEGDPSFFHEFEFTAGVDLGPDNSLTTTGLPGDPPAPGTDWTPLSFSATGQHQPAGVVFAGYGIEIPEGEGDGGAYSSYAHLDAKDKWAMIFRYLPEDLDREGRRRFSQYGSLRHKALTARRQGARGIIVVSGPNSGVVQQLVPLTYDASMADSGVAAISITDTLAARLLKTAGKELGKIQGQLDTGEMAGGFTLPGIQLAAHIDITQEKRTGRSVVARLASPHPQRPALVIGAHIDHLGSKAGASSRAKDDEQNRIHHGADDNASGVAATLEIAELLSTQVKKGELKLQRDILFATWSGEELGLLGVSKFLAATALQIHGDTDAKLAGQFAANLNMDMVGRLEKTLVLQGVGSSPAAPREIERRNAPIGLPITTQKDSYLPTDATQFYLRGIPVLNAFTGAHEDYHRPTDTADKINYGGARDITRLIALIARGLATSSQEPAYLETEKPEYKGSRGGLRVYLGTIPNYAQGDVVGVKLSGVGKLGPAQKAGLQAGDTIIKLAGEEIKNIYDYTYALGDLKVGEETTITILRDDKTIQLKITPGSRE